MAHLDPEEARAIIDAALKRMIAAALLTSTSVHYASTIRNNEIIFYSAE